MANDGKIFNNPELPWKETAAHGTICDFLEELGFNVTRHAYGLATRSRHELDQEVAW
jgi:metal-dependent amidase/aminoacylase/carboxypeptidase family protein